ncbi:MAG: efflux transporter outer membrane subunit [Alphaproteobacteria bacterium]|nr:efflux transporter outer membrane subunit [Alphaproteobacteria bacterium]
MKGAVSSFALAAWLAACASAPEPATPEAAPPAWTMRDAAAMDVTLAPWWLSFNDPLLNTIVMRAEGANDLAIAEARLDEARAGLVRAYAALAPDIAAQGSVSRDQNGDDPAAVDTRRGAGVLTWTLDLFGAGRARAASARATAQAFEARRDDVRLRTRAAAALLYIAVRDAQAQGQAAAHTVASLDDATGLADSRYRAGLAPEFDVAQARAALAAARARPPALARAEREARLSLEALLGYQPGALAAHLSPMAAIPFADASVYSRAPASVLAERPDVRAAERAFISAGYDARAARRDFWPSVSLSALIGTQAVTPASPFASDGDLASSSALASLPIFSFGRLESARAGADARMVAAAASYRQAALDALRDVEIAFAAVEDSGARTMALTAALAAAQDQTALARSRYRAGLSPFLDVLTAERAVFDAEAALAGARADSGRAAVALALAMGLDDRAASSDG